MLRITITGSADTEVTMLLEGTIAGNTLEEVRSSCERVLNLNRRLTLDLAGTLFVDRKGVLLLQTLAVRHVNFVNCSGFIAEQLKSNE
jgi:ABC-type transporter Mla MlaB component